jgi:hypothetical protein
VRFWAYKRIIYLIVYLGVLGFADSEEADTDAEFDSLQAEAEGQLPQELVVGGVAGDSD